MCDHYLKNGDAGFPARLASIPDAPARIWVRGSPAHLPAPGHRSLAIVGSRTASRDGLDAARRIAHGLARMGVVIVSGFDPVRREIARLALGKLIADGRIHPSRIEEVVAETQREMEAVIRKHGEEAALEADVPNLHPRLIELLGRLRFRTSYSQNVLRHSIEVAFLTGMMAEEVGLNGDLARRAGLLHDIGKAADHETEGGHPQIGADLLKRHNEGPEVVHAAKAGTGPELRPGMFMTIEPMINLGRPWVKLLNDGWTAVTRDKSLSAQFEHSIGITEDGVEIFTKSPAGLDKPPY